MTKIFSFIRSKKKYSDQELYQGLLANKAEIIEYLYREFPPLARALLLRQGGKEEEIQDAIQEGMIALWKNTRQGKYQLNENAKMSTYFVEVCKRRWAEKNRKKKNQSSMSIDEMPLLSPNPNALELWLKKEEMEQFETVYEQLNERCRQMLRRFYYEKESMKQIALAFAITEATARNQKYRCMQSLKNAYQSKDH